MTASTTGSNVLWTTKPALSADVRVFSYWLVQPSGAAIEAAQRAAAALSVRLPVDSSQPVAIVYPGYERRADILKTRHATSRAMDD